MKKKSKIKKLSNSDILAGNRFIGKFVGLTWHTRPKWWKGTNIDIELVGQIYKQESVKKINFPIDISNINIKKSEFHSNWQWLMFVVDKIESLGCVIFIEKHHTRVTWSYSKKLELSFTNGSNSYKWTQKRSGYFDSFGGKYHQYCIGIKDTAEKTNAETKIFATYIACLKFIKWYNKRFKPNGEHR